MAESAQRAVDSLLGRLTSALLEEAQLLRGVRGEVQFIKREMESMSGFLLDVSEAAAGRRPSNQVSALARQVQARFLLPVEKKISAVTNKRGFGTYREIYRSK